MNAYSVELYNDEKSANQCQIHMESKTQCCCGSESNPSRHRACHQARLRRFLLPIALLLLGVGATVLISCIYDIDPFDLVSMGGGNPLGKRQTTSGGQSSFTQHKLYLIIVFVGLALVLVAGIMLSFWCCKGKVHLRTRSVAHVTCARAVVELFAWSALDADCVRLDWRLLDANGEYAT
ncbi:hypothetical protein JVT61DRAFT_7577 [Boletus reticuloceps]|uniref:Uncharacterized protein n=1 Tax=Boletus reticuloceps TaxID=495285 RepID=A0A8I2YI21_9AGAM|nr:hypothetical protein JVT61DRAFT_7577 [Boletus reticuloceps]